jgi:hypothetical protein
MADDKTDRWRPDRDRIHITEVYELRYWSDKLGVTKEELAAAVKRVGPMIRDVEVELKRAPRANG